MLFLGSASALLGYLLIFAAVQGGRFIRNPLLGVTETAGAGTGGGTSAGGTGPVGGGPRISVPGAPRKCQLIIDNYNAGKDRWDYSAARWKDQGCPGDFPDPPGTAHGTASQIRDRRGAQVA